MRSLLPAAVAAFAVMGPCPPARAEEPLFLHIRSDAAADDAPAARRAALWARSDARARLAIASVCTGCLKPVPPVPGLPQRRHDTTEIASHSEPTRTPEGGAPDSASAPATLLATAGEP